MNHADCAHCTHSHAEWTGAGSGVALLCDMGFPVRNTRHSCVNYQREPGADDDLGDRSDNPERGPW